LLALLTLAPGVARAGMGSVVPTDWATAMRLTESAHARFEAVSFFIAGLLFSALAVRWLWNGLAKDFSVLPRLTYGKSLAAVTLWGLLFLVVLTMIAATRELMTPGAWRKVGMLYQVTEDPPPPPPPEDPQRIAERTRHFQRLRSVLWHWHDENGSFPSASDPNIPASLWEVPGGAGARYLYVAGRSDREPNAILAVEPALYGDERLVLCCNGEITMVRTADINKQLPK
jgi:hypothetical protein